jgi:hypothetical protein
VRIAVHIFVQGEGASLFRFTVCEIVNIQRTDRLMLFHAIFLNFIKHWTFEMNIKVIQGASSLAPMPGSGRAAQRRATPDNHISIAGVVLLSAMAVVLTILGVLLLGAFMVGVWWLVSHIPVPAFIWRLINYIGLHV